MIFSPKSLARKLLKGTRHINGKLHDGHYHPAVCRKSRHPIGGRLLKKTSLLISSPTYWLARIQAICFFLPTSIRIRKGHFVLPKHEFWTERAVLCDSPSLEMAVFTTARPYRVAGAPSLNLNLYPSHKETLVYNNFTVLPVPLFPCSPVPLFNCCCTFAILFSAIALENYVSLTAVACRLSCLSAENIDWNSSSSLAG